MDREHHDILRDEAPGIAPAVASHPSLTVPRAAQLAEGIMLGGKRVRSLVFSTDLAVICNCDADAVLAVYPFVCQKAIIHGLLAVPDRPVITGVGGSLTPPEKSIRYAAYAHEQGLAGVVVNMTFSVDALRTIARDAGVPLVLTIGELNDEARRRIEAGASVLNVAAGKRTEEVVADVRAAYPEFPLMASGGPTEKTAAATIAAGAQAVSWTPPNIQDLEHALMKRTRKKATHEE